MQFRDLPSVDRVMASDGMAALTEAYPHDWVVDLVRRQLDRARQKIRDGGTAPSAGDVADGVSGELRSMTEPAPRQVINATGVIIHTNLGRAPLSPAAIEAMTQTARGYTDLEMDLSTGRRGYRPAHPRHLPRPPVHQGRDVRIYGPNARGFQRVPQRGRRNRGGAVPGT